MENITFSSSDINNIIKYIKSHIEEFGSDMIKHLDEFKNMSEGQIESLNKLKLKYGEQYINELNKWKSEYIDFKGGAWKSAKPMIGLRKPLPQIPTQKKPMFSPQTQQKFQTYGKQASKGASNLFVSALTGQAQVDKYGRPTALGALGSAASPFLQQLAATGASALQAKIMGQPAYPQQSIYAPPAYPQQPPMQQLPMQQLPVIQPAMQQLPMQQPVIQPAMQQPVIQPPMQPVQPVQQVQPALTVSSTSNTEKLKQQVCNICNENPGSVDQFVIDSCNKCSSYSQQQGGKRNADLDSVFMEHNLPSNLGTESDFSISNKQQKKNKKSQPKIIVENSLFTLDGLTE
ncbi:hypothetical protein QKU48_gp0488 [Fadolivirus algeromassiliense]|jgi:hypothetical protein|uniref:Uncharacterized protein n=1 Tax=Fadolivirus FV1/VV64 TaxID=3070911 RepID=A0A7D3QVN1_9VIRU|nr:hypothetical protein QKU48_gp0488 [Fadolivirus algeromassiliense]QKF93946.1 hypothetical protein Fadolivirus_1_488 [Fadolivirus FV1/VV64]